MNRREHSGRPVGFDRDSARFQDAECLAEQCFCRSSTEADDDLGFDERDLVFEPREAGTHLADVRCLVQTSRRPRVARPLEVLHGICDVNVIAVDARRVERAIEQLPGRSDERVPSLVFGVAGLFADHHDSCARRTFAEDGLRPELEQVTSAAAFRSGAQLRQRRARRNEVSGGAGCFRCFSRLRHVADGLR